MSDNSWYRKGELPPVGVLCEAAHGGLYGYWEKIEILKHDLNFSFNGDSSRIACISISGTKDAEPNREIGELFWLYNVKDGDCKFRPIKTERDISIEAAVDAIDHLGYGRVASREIATKIYDAGFRKNES